MREATYALHEIHQIHSSVLWGYGWEVDRLMLPPAFLASTIQGVPESTHRQAAEFLKSFLCQSINILLKPRVTVTLHGDPKQEHFLNAGGQIYVVDWESTLFGPPEMDFAIFAFSLLPKLPFEQFIKLIQEWNIEYALFNALFLWHAALHCLWNPWRELLPPLEASWERILKTLDMPSENFLRQNEVLTDIARSVNE